MLAVPVVVAGCSSVPTTGSANGLRRSPAASTSPTSPPRPASGVRAVLPPATVAPVSDECSIPQTHDEDANVAPLLCTGGGVNAPAWRYYESGSLSGKPEVPSAILALGRRASSDQVLRAMCTDHTDKFGTGPLADSAEQLAAAYDGWRFTGAGPAAEFEAGDCPAP